MTGPASTARQSGVARIFAYNWPTYAATWAAAVLALVSIAWLPARLAPLIVALAAGAVLWSGVSLLVSFYVYDRSALVQGRWVAPLLGEPLRTWAAVHAGLDAEIDLDRAMPGECAKRLDIFDPAFMTAPSIRRARAKTAQTHPSTPCSPVSLPLEDGACDAVVVAFTAHEIRDTQARERFFDEVRRCLRPGGRALLVEHLRDIPNFLAFGPGYLHFVARSEWLRLAKHANLMVAREERITPWVMALTLERAA